MNFFYIHFNHTFYNNDDNLDNAKEVHALEAACVSKP